MEGILTSEAQEVLKAMDKASLPHILRYGSYSAAPRRPLLARLVSWIWPLHLLLRICVTAS